jgi:hypothetical protein
LIFFFSPPFSLVVLFRLLSSLALPALVWSKWTGFAACVISHGWVHSVGVHGIYILEHHDQLLSYSVTWLFSLVGWWVWLGMKSILVWSGLVWSGSGLSDTSSYESHLSLLSFVTSLRRHATIQLSTVQYNTIQKAFMSGS